MTDMDDVWARVRTVERGDVVVYRPRRGTLTEKLARYPERFGQRFVVLSEGDHAVMVHDPERPDLEPFEVPRTSLLAEDGT